MLLVMRDNEPRFAEALMFLFYKTQYETYREYTPSLYCHFPFRLPYLSQDYGLTAHISSLRPRRW